MKEHLLAKILTTIIATLLSIGLGADKIKKPMCGENINSYWTMFSGTWDVETKDRLSPGVYETNSGQSSINLNMNGCGIQESYEGIYRDKIYKREVMITSRDSTHLGMISFDSEHADIQYFTGEIEHHETTLIWYRDRNVKRLQSKYILNRHSNNEFEFSSFLSTDHGETWALTHERKYQRLAED